MKLVPLYDRVVVREVEDEEEKKTAAGLFLPSGAEPDTIKGEVVATGEGRILESGDTVAPRVDVGDIVVFSPAVGRDVKVDGVNYRVIRETEILAIVLPAADTDDEA